jgi:hypothetical protein
MKGVDVMNAHTRMATTILLKGRGGIYEKKKINPIDDDDDHHVTCTVLYCFPIGSVFYAKCRASSFFSSNFSHKAHTIHGQIQSKIPNPADRTSSTVKLEI